MILAASFTGPLPHPSALQAYENISPGFALRILKMAEDSQASHVRMDEETVALAKAEQANEKVDRAASRAEVKRGQILGFSLCLAVVVVCCVLALNGRETTASILGGTTIVSLAVAFLSQAGAKAPRVDEKVAKKS